MGMHFNPELFSQRLIEAMADNNETTYSLGEHLNLSPGTISRYTTGEIKKPKLPTIQAMAHKLGVNINWLLGQEGEPKYSETKNRCTDIPVLGTIAAGEPLLAQQNIEDYDCAAPAIGATFCLRVKGDSMVNARILDGDVVYIREQLDVENGEIAAVLIEDCATLKRVYKINGTVVLRAENPNYPDQIYSKKDFKNIKILGKAIYFRSEVR